MEPDEPSGPDSEDELHRICEELNLNPNELDSRLLDSFIDYLAIDTKLPDGVSKPTLRLMFYQRLQSDPEFLQLLNLLSKSNYWNDSLSNVNLHQIVCLTCGSTSCKHISRDKSISNKNHKEESPSNCNHRDIFSRIRDSGSNYCIQCIKGFSSNDSPPNSSFHLWNTEDLAKFAKTVDQLNLSFGALN